MMSNDITINYYNFVKNIINIQFYIIFNRELEADDNYMGIIAQYF